MSPSKAEKPETKPCLTMPLRAVSPVSAGLNQKDIRLSANEASTFALPGLEKRERTDSVPAPIAWECRCLPSRILGDGASRASHKLARSTA